METVETVLAFVVMTAVVLVAAILLWAAYR